MDDELKGYTEIREIKTYHIKVKTKADAESILKLAITSQDEIVSLIGQRRGYDAQVSHLVARDWPSGQTPD